MKKLNAVLSLALILVLLVHGAIMEYSMLTFWADPTLFHIVGGIAVALICLHALISVINLFFLHDGGNVSAYPKKNIQTIIQRASAIAIAIVLHFHSTNFDFIVTPQSLTAPEKWLHGGTEVLFSLFVAVHVITSFGRALVTLGAIKTDKGKKAADRAASIIMGILGLLFMGTAAYFFVIV
ncbi:MAG: hypothetical protein HUJ75_05720 [Parasporobacterium sp.]|nr:hypothetical protein [Parasporobacterium sp.]